MVEIVLTEEQARVVAGAARPVVVRDPKGVTLGVLDPREGAILAEAKRRLAAPGLRYSSAAVTAMLDALQAERDRIGPFDAEYMHEFVRRLEAADPEKYGPGERP